MTQLIIPMSGRGDRFKKAGYEKLKPLIEVDGKTIVNHVLDMFPEISNILFIVNKEEPQALDLKSELIRIYPNAKIAQIEPHKLGPSWAIWSAREFIQEDMKIIVSYCDFKANWNPEDMLKQLESFDGSVLTYTGFHPHMLRNDKYAYVRKSSDLVQDIQEKNPYTTNPMDEEASAGVYGFRSSVELFKALDLQFAKNLNFNGEFYTSLTIKALLELSLKVGTVSAKSFSQWGTPEDLEDWIYYKSAVNEAHKVSTDLELDQLPGICLILAAGRGARLSELTNVSKPNIPIAGKKLWDFSLDIALQFQSRFVITRSELNLDSENLDQITRHNLEKITQGQAHTAKIALDLCDSDPNLPATILSADNLVSATFAEVSLKMIYQCDLLIWTSAKYPPAQLQAEQYSWVDVSGEGLITGVQLKKRPDGMRNPRMIIGNFSFRSKKLGQQLINSLMDSGQTVNGEYYLDSVIELALNQGLRVESLEIDNFMAIGTKIELETFRYFEGELNHAK